MHRNRKAWGLNGEKMKIFLFASIFSMEGEFSLSMCTGDSDGRGTGFEKRGEERHTEGRKVNLVRKQTGIAWRDEYNHLGFGLKDLK